MVELQGQKLECEEEARKKRWALEEDISVAFNNGKIFNFQRDS